MRFITIVMIEESVFTPVICIFIFFIIICFERFGALLQTRDVYEHPHHNIKYHQSEGSKSLHVISLLLLFSLITLMLHKPTSSGSCWASVRCFICPLHILYWFYSNRLRQNLHLVADLLAIFQAFDSIWCCQADSFFIPYFIQNSRAHL